MARLRARLRIPDRVAVHAEARAVRTFRLLCRRHRRVGDVRPETPFLTTGNLLTTIVLAADQNYLPFVPCNIAQLARFGRSADGLVLAVPVTVGEDLLAPIRLGAAAYGLGLEIATIAELEPLHDSRVISGAQHISYFTYSKLLLAEVLPEVDDVLYLDIDTLIRAPLDELLSWELRHPVGAVHDWASGEHLFGTSRRPYFNAGVLRLSLARMRRENLWSQARRIFKTRNLRIVDQDVFNLLFSDRFDSLPPTFNVFDSLTQRRDGFAVVRDPAIVHFAGQKKPWHRSQRSQYAREWRRMYSAARFATHLPNEVRERPSVGTYGKARSAGRSRLGSAARTVLPPRVKRVARDAACEAADRAMCRLEEFQATSQPRLVPSVYPVIPAEVHGPTGAAGARPDRHGSGLDLLISLPRSGTNALGRVLQRGHPGVNWLNELYIGQSEGLRDGELLDRFPWFSDGDPTSQKAMAPKAREEARRVFAASVNENAIGITETVLQSRRGRTLIKVFPDQLDPAVFGEMLRVFRPRLLILRREMVFSYISLLRALRAQSWMESDLGDVGFVMTDSSALQYTVHADGWIDFVSRLAQRLQLEAASVTYNGLFTTGSDVPLLKSLYPGHAMDVDETGKLRSSLRLQDRRSDASVLAMLQAVTRLSAATQSQLLRLPGSHGTVPSIPSAAT